MRWGSNGMAAIFGYFLLLPHVGEGAGDEGFAGDLTGVDPGITEDFEQAGGGGY